MKASAELEERLRTSMTTSCVAGRHWVFRGLEWIRRRNCARRTALAPATRCLTRYGERLVHGLRPAEEMSRWGDEEFLVVAHERSAEMLARHAKTLAGLARTADFRWWGDRVSITVSIGEAQAGGVAEERLAQLLERAREAMETSNQAGGNRAIVATANDTAATCGGIDMFAIIGMFVVFAAIIAGFLMEKGHMVVLIQPAELLIIARRGIRNAAGGESDAHSEGTLLPGLLASLKGSPFTKTRYLSTLKMMYQFLNKVRKEGSAGRGDGRGEARRRARSSRTIRSFSATITPWNLSATRCVRPSRAAWSHSTWTR